MQQGSPLAATCNESRFLQHAAKARTCCALSYVQQQAKSMTNRSGCHPEQAFMLRLLLWLNVPTLLSCDSSSGRLHPATMSPTSPTAMRVFCETMDACLCLTSLMPPAPKLLLCRRDLHTLSFRVDFSAGHHSILEFVRPNRDTDSEAGAQYFCRQSCGWAGPRRAASRHLDSSIQNKSVLGGRHCINNRWASQVPSAFHSKA